MIQEVIVMGIIITSVILLFRRKKACDGCSKRG